MTRKAIFEGLVIDELDRPVPVVYIGDDPCYVVDDFGFRRHISSDHVDRQVLDEMRNQITGHEDMIGEQAAKMMGQDDIFSRAMIMAQLKNIDGQMDQLFETGIPEDARAYMGMMGFRIRIDLHGDVLEIEQPGVIDEGE